MFRSKIHRTTVFRLALAYMALLGASIIILSGVGYWGTVGYLQRQMDGAITTDLAGLIAADASGGAERLAAALTERMGEDPAGDNVYVLADGTFAPMAGTLARWPGERTIAASWVNLELGERDGDTQAVRARTVTLPDGLHLLVGRDLHDVYEVREIFLRAMGWGLALSLALAAAGGVLLSTGTLRRIEEINRTSRGIVAGELGHRVPVRGTGDDFDELARTLNAMLDRIEALVATVKGVSNDIAHDLRTPLARLKTRLELARMEPPAPAAFDAWMDGTIANVDAVLSTFDSLLRIAAIEARQPMHGFTSVDLHEIASDVVEYCEPLAEEKEQTLALLGRGPLTIQGDRHLLFRALANLVDNAIKYAARGGRITLELRERGGAAEVIVADNGPGIPEEARARVFERFVRLEPARSLPGSGLGLSLVAAIAEQHGAAVVLDDNLPGVRATLRFPAAVPA